MDVSIGAIVWFLVGYGLAYGYEDDISGGYIGLNGVKYIYDGEIDYMNWFFQFAFAATASTIVSGSVAERTKLESYFLYSCIITMFVYPVVVHWVWDKNGWMSALNPNAVFPVIDFAGSGVVHMVG